MARGLCWNAPWCVYLYVLYTKTHYPIKIVKFLFALVAELAPEKPPNFLRTRLNLNQKESVSTLIFVNESVI